MFYSIDTSKIGTGISQLSQEIYWISQLSQEIYWYRTGSGNTLSQALSQLRRSCCLAKKPPLNREGGIAASRGKVDSGRIGGLGVDGGRLLSPDGRWAAGGEAEQLHEAVLAKLLRSAVGQVGAHQAGALALLTQAANQAQHAALRV